MVRRPIHLHVHSASRDAIYKQFITYSSLYQYVQVLIVVSRAGLSVMYIQKTVIERQHTLAQCSSFQVLHHSSSDQSQSTSASTHLVRWRCD
jgi:hypothetical protein